jgi:hypothetical protein
MTATTDELLKAAEQLSLPELETFIARVVALHAQRVVTAGQLPEVDLVRLIRDAVPASLQQRYDELKASRRAGTLTPAEHDEFLRLIDLVEQLDAQRVQHLAQLAQVRGTTLEQVMSDLGIRAPAVA